MGHCGNEISTLEGPGSDIEWVDWHPRGAVLLAGSTDMTCWMWQAKSATCMQVFAGHEGPVTCGQFAPNGRFVVTGGADGTVRLWSLKSGKCRFVFKDKRCAGWHPSDQHAILTLACSDDSSLVLTGSDDGTSRLASIVPKKERVVATLQHRREELWLATLSNLWTSVTMVHPSVSPPDLQGFCAFGM